MTPAESADFERARAKQQEAEDLADIAELRRTTAWNRYWMRRLRVKREAFAKAFKDDPMTHEEREVMRNRVLLIEEIEKIADKDEGSIRAAQQENTRSQ